MFRCPVSIPKHFWTTFNRAGAEFRERLLKLTFLLSIKNIGNSPSRRNIHTSSMQFTIKYLISSHKKHRICQLEPEKHVSEVFKTFWEGLLPELQRRTCIGALIFDNIPVLRIRETKIWTGLAPVDGVPPACSFCFCPHSKKTLNKKTFRSSQKRTCQKWELKQTWSGR